VEFGEAWLAARGKRLGLGLEAAAQRDRAMTSTAPPPAGFWDEQLALQAASLWRLVCNECHAGRRGIASASAIPAPTAGWTEKTGRFFGRARSHQQIFETIARGIRGPAGSSMPAFEEKLSREQIWGLVHFLEEAGGPAAR
jgi:mono/diheme cytochrome c family protein